jgi:hypothetical protein
LRVGLFRIVDGGMVNAVFNNGPRGSLFGFGKRRIVHGPEVRFTLSAERDNRVHGPNMGIGAYKIGVLRPCPKLSPSGSIDVNKEVSRALIGHCRIIKGVGSQRIEIVVACGRFGD